MDEFKITKQEENIIESAKGVVLSASEKSGIKASIISHMNSNPISAVSKPRTVYSVFDFVYHRSTYLVPAIAVVLLVFGLNSSSNPEQLASLDNVDTAKMDTVGTSATFSTMSAPVDTQVQLMQANEVTPPSASEEAVNTRMMKSYVSMDAVASSTDDSEDKEESYSESVSKIKSQINTSYKNFIGKIFNFTKSKNKDYKKENVSTTTAEIKVLDRKSEKKVEHSKSESKTNDDIDKENENEDEDDDKNDDSRSVVQPTVVPKPPITTPAPIQVPVVTSYTLIEVSKHSTSEDCWAVVSGGVYNLTSWISQHPGGESAIKGMCGLDATVGFLVQHNGDTKAVNTLVTYKIGVLK